MTHRPSSLLTALVLVALAAAACTLPGAAPPTPFTFPTPNLTLTAVFAPTVTPSPPPPTLPPLPTPTVGGAPPAVPTATTAPAGSQRPNGTPLTASFLASPPTIDGDLSDWNTTPYTVNHVVFGATAWSGSSDLSGTAYLGWDEQYLYVAVDVTDDTFVQTSTGALMYKGDEVEIQFDADLPGDFTSTSLSADDFQLGLSPGNFGSRSPEAYRWYPLAQSGPLVSVQVAAKQTADGYALEARIPWAVFGVTPADGARYGFALSISDNDLAGAAVQQSMVSSVSTRTLTDPTTWGTLILEAGGGGS